MQSLYGFFQGGANDLEKKEKELFNSLDKIYDLYLYLLALLIEIQHSAKISLEDAKNKRLPSEKDLNPNLKFTENIVLNSLSNNAFLLKEIHNRKISWQNDLDLVKKVFLEIKSGDDYADYMKTENNELSQDKLFAENIVRNCIADHELTNHYFEDRSIHWSDDTYIAINALIKTIQSTDNQGKITIQPLYKDSIEDKQFARDLFVKCAVHSNEFEEMISGKTQNWEIERIAFLDTLLMKLALTEVLFFQNIPVKVSLDEYIEISKNYSSQKSKIFINGVLDKIISELKKENKISKTGRGLIEN